MDLTLLNNATLKGINNRVEYHGEDKVTAVDLSIEINDLEAGELDQLALDGNHYSTALWHEGSPRFPLLNGMSISAKIENHSARVSIESADQLPVKDRGTVAITPAVIKKIKFMPKHHGLADVTLQVQGHVAGHELAKMVDQYLAERIQLSIEPIQQSLLDAEDTDRAA